MNERRAVDEAPRNSSVEGVWISREEAAQPPETNSVESLFTVALLAGLGRHLIEAEARREETRLKVEKAHADATRRALKILEKDGPLTHREFADRFYAGSPYWRTRVGKARKFLDRLHKHGLVDVRRGTRKYVINQKGRAFLNERQGTVEKTENGGSQT